jgi:hypothetical protein
MGDLKEKKSGAVIKGSDCRVRHAVGMRGLSGRGVAPVPSPLRGGDSPGTPWVLAEKAPASVPVAVKKGAENAAVRGAVLPIWLTVPVPKDATAGDYEGTLTVSPRIRCATPTTSSRGRTSISG